MSSEPAQVGLSSISSPEIGQAVRVRNRLASIRSIAAQESLISGSIQHVVEIEYLDDRHSDVNDTILWELEPEIERIGDASLPDIDTHTPDSPQILHSFVNAHRWTRINRFSTGNEIEREPLLSVWNSAIQVHSYQIVPVVRALQMPRVSLLLADGVGLGKTIQAGLVLQELLLRRRVRRVLIVCPAQLQRQWQSELSRKFNIEFEIVDSETSFETRKRLGLDTNPWKAYPRLITSMDYLRQPDVRQQLMAASGVGATSESASTMPYAPWDLLIVDEAHNLAPQNSRRNSQRYRMLSEIRFLFEHRIYLTATPHNGKTVSFTGLLQLLDPVRFQIRPKMDDLDRSRLDQIKVRRLKDDIKRCILHAPFADLLPIIEIPTLLTSQESELFKALREYRKVSQANLEESGSASERWIGHFIFSVLTKRLLSCPLAFAKTWWRHVEEDQNVLASDLLDLAVVASERSEDVASNDAERSLAEEDVSRYGGAWLRRRLSAIESAQARVGSALEKLGYGRSVIEDDMQSGLPKGLSDSKTEELVKWIRANLRTSAGTLRNDERLIIFTEYKETLEFIRRRLLREGFNENTLQLLFGGMGTNEFKAIQEEFEDKDSPVRLLLATDAASEGINLQAQCRWIIHYDIPWSPTKIQQRNGRVWRHGQLRDVQIHYFRCDQDEDLDFLLKVARKVETVRDDLGSVEEVFDRALHNHFRGRKTDLTLLDVEIARAQVSSSEHEDITPETDSDILTADSLATRLLEKTQATLGITPRSLEAVMRAAIKVEGNGALSPILAKPGFYRLDSPPSWESLARQSMSIGKSQHRPEVLFDETLVTEEHSGRRLMRVGKHQVLLRLSHPIMQRAMSVLRSQQYEPRGDNAIRRWTLAAINRPGFECLAILHYVATATNSLRETLHDEVISKVFRVDGSLLSPVAAEYQDLILHETSYSIASDSRRGEWIRTLRLKWDDHRKAFERVLSQHQTVLKSEFEKMAAENLKVNLKSTRDAYDRRLKALDESRRDKEEEKAARQLVEAEIKADQPTFFEDINESRDRRVREIRELIESLQLNMDDLKRRLESEKEERLTKLIPGRFTIKDVRVIPLALEYLIPALPEDLP